MGNLEKNEYDWVSVEDAMPGAPSASKQWYSGLLDVRNGGVVMLGWYNLCDDKWYATSKGYGALKELTEVTHWRKR